MHTIADRHHALPLGLPHRVDERAPDQVAENVAFSVQRRLLVVIQAALLVLLAAAAVADVIAPRLHAKTIVREPARARQRIGRSRCKWKGGGGSLGSPTRPANAAAPP